MIAERPNNSLSSSNHQASKKADRNCTNAEEMLPKSKLTALDLTGNSCLAENNTPIVASFLRVWCQSSTAFVPTHRMDGGKGSMFQFLSLLTRGHATGFHGHSLYPHCTKKTRMFARIGNNQATNIMRVSTSTWTYQGLDFITAINSSASSSSFLRCELQSAVGTGLNCEHQIAVGTTRPGPD